MASCSADNMMRILVLGASGQIGSRIYIALKTLHETVGTTRNNSDSLKRFDPFLDDWSSLGKFDAIINCIGVIDSTSTVSFYKIHVDLVKVLLKNRHILGDPRIIQVSALGASASHRVEFLRTKGLADDLLNVSNTIILRPSIVCTPNTMLVKKMLMLSAVSKFTAGLVIVPEGFLNTKIQPVMIDDLAALIIKLCETPGMNGCLNVTGPEIITFRDILDILFGARQRKYKTIEVPKPIMNSIVQLLNLFSSRFISTQQFQLLFENNVADSSEAQKILGRLFTPVLPFFKNYFRNANH